MKLKLGFIGTNFVSDWMADAANACENIEATAIFSRTKQNGDAFAARHGIQKVYTDLEEFLSSNIEAVYVASPNSLHFDHTMAALAHGKHVLCEKPVSSNIHEFEETASAAKKNGLILLEAMRPAFDPALESIKSALPEIGTIRRASFEFCQYSSRYDKFLDGDILRAFNPSFSNAAVMDIGVYPVHFCLRLFGAPSGKISSSSVILPNGFEGCGTVIFPYEEMVASISYSKICDSVSPSVITGEKGSITIDKISCPSNIELIARDGTRKAITFGYKPNNMVFELEEFARLIDCNDIENKHIEFSRMEILILDEIRAQNGIVFPSDFNNG